MDAQLDDLELGGGCADRQLQSQKHALRRFVGRASAVASDVMDRATSGLLHGMRSAAVAYVETQLAQIPADHDIEDHTDESETEKAMM